jgi:hypothetical protein
MYRTMGGSEGTLHDRLDEVPTVEKEKSPSKDNNSVEIPEISGQNMIYFEFYNALRSHQC